MGWLLVLYVLTQTGPEILTYPAKDERQCNWLLAQVRGMDSGARVVIGGECRQQGDV